MDPHVHIVTNRQHGTLSIGVTSDIARRAWQHREGAIEGFTAKHGLKRLTFVERQETIAPPSGASRPLKTWRRAWKVRLIEAANRGSGSNGTESSIQHAMAG